TELLCFARHPQHRDAVDTGRDHTFGQPPKAVTVHGAVGREGSGQDVVHAGQSLHASSLTGISRSGSLPKWHLTCEKPYRAWSWRVRACWPTSSTWARSAPTPAVASAGSPARSLMSRPGPG